MKKYKNSDIGKTIEGYKRVDKREARRLYESGTPLVITPSRVNRLDMWAAPATKLISKNFMGNFDAVVEDYEKNFCYDIAETGDYAKYYVQVAPRKRPAKEAKA